MSALDTRIYAYGKVSVAVASAAAAAVTAAVQPAVMAIAPCIRLNYGMQTENPLVPYE